MKKTTILKKMLSDKGVIIAPGAYDCLSAKLIEKAGYKLIMTTGAGICASILGAPDIGVATMPEILTSTKNIVNSTNLPVLADCDNGYGGIHNVMRTVNEFEAAGVAGLWIEDQIFPKRCGHFAGKKIVSKVEMCTKIKAAVAARTDPDLVIMARTDARAEFGIEEAVERTKAYINAGADVIFIEAPQTLEELRYIGSSLDRPLIINLVEGGKTPLFSEAELESMGFKIITYSGSLQKVSIKAMINFLENLSSTGDVRKYVDDMVSLNERSEILGLNKFYDLEKRFSFSETI